jgi:hypothetical protein
MAEAGLFRASMWLANGGCIAFWSQRRSQSAIDAQQHRFAPITKWSALVRLAASVISGKSAAPVVPVAGPEPHALAFAPNKQAVAVMLHLVKKIRVRGHFGAAGRDAGQESSFAHGRSDRPAASKMVNEH